MLNKKYYTINEVTTFCKIHSHQLRYIEKRFSNFVILKIKGRRYYTNENIEFIKLNLHLTKIQSQEALPNSYEMLKKIDNLIYKFYQVKMNLCLTN